MATKTIDIEGMSCGHCVNWVTGALQKIDGIQSVEVSLEAKNAVVDYEEGRVDDDTMTSAIEKAGYTVKSPS